MDDPPKRLTKISKGSGTRRLLMGALKRNELFSGATPEQLEEMVDAFRRVEIDTSTCIIRQGQNQHAFFVVESGDLDVLVTEVQRTPTRNGMATRKQIRRTATLSKGNTFGERALMEERKSGATFKTTGPCVLWQVDKEVFNSQFLVNQSHVRRRASQNRIRAAVQEHPYFHHLQDEAAEENVIANFFTVDFKKKEVVVYEGSHGDNYYIVNKGILDVYRPVYEEGNNHYIVNQGDEMEMTTSKGKRYIKVKTLNPGDWFGELTLKFPKLVSEERIVARTPCQVYAMERSHFQQLARTGAHHLQDRFNRYASRLHPNAGQFNHHVEERVMTIDDFFNCQLAAREATLRMSIEAEEDETIEDESDRGATIGLLKLLFESATTDFHDDLLDFHDYYSLNILMSKKHSEYEIAFRMMDTQRKGVITRGQLGMMLSSIAGYRGGNAMRKLSRDENHLNLVKKLMLDEEGGDIRYEDFQRMIESGELPNVVADLCGAIRAETRIERAQRGLGVAAAALTDTALSSVIAESDVTSVSVVSTMIAGGVAGAISRTLTAPLERLALLMQVQKMQRTLSKGTNATPPYKGVLQGLRTIYHTTGVKSFFWGNGVNILRLVPQRGISFSLFEQWKEYVRDEEMEASIVRTTENLSSTTTAANTVYQHALGGALSTAFAGALCYPIDVVRTRVTVQNVQKGHLPLSASSILRNIGSMRELYSGFTPTMIKNMPEWGLNFAVFEMLRVKFVENNTSDNRSIHKDDNDNNISVQDRSLRLLACGAVTSFVSQTFVYPLETIRRNMQIAQWTSRGGEKMRIAIEGGGSHHVQLLSPHRNYSSVPTMFQTAASIYARRGLRGFYSGLVPTYLRVVPATASGFAIYQGLLEALKE